MIQLGDKLELEKLDSVIENIAKKRADNYRKQFENFTKKDSTDDVTKEAMTNITSRGEKTWWNYELMASNEKDENKIREIYLQGIKEFPKSSGLLGNYAIFLKNVKKEYDESEKYYLKALKIEPENAIINGNYALFLSNIRKLYDEAEKYYLKALKSEPNHANNNGNYANFLFDIRKDYDEAEKYYLKALKNDSDHSNNNGNYANFLSDIRKDYDEAEKYYLKALKSEPNHANNNGNYAKHLIICNKKNEAIKYINKTFELNNGDEESIALELWFYCYAIFPNEYPQSKKNIEELLSKGIKSIGWDFSEILKIAEKENHPEYKQLVEFEKRITQP